MHWEKYFSDINKKITCNEFFTKWKYELIFNHKTNNYTQILPYNSIIYKYYIQILTTENTLMLCNCLCNCLLIKTLS